MRTIGFGTWISSLIEDCNGRNVFDDTHTASPIISLEHVLNKNPQVIIIPHHSGSAVANHSVLKKTARQFEWLAQPAPARL